jgi:hypothetical protein
VADRTDTAETPKLRQRLSTLVVAPVFRGCCYLQSGSHGAAAAALVSELTGNWHVNLNVWVSLRPHQEALSLGHRAISRPGINESPGCSQRFSQGQACKKMSAESHERSRILWAAAEWKDMWHLWCVLVPRRSISGELVWGQVWRRSDYGRWIYKRMVEYGESSGSPTHEQERRPISRSFVVIVLQIVAVAALAALGWIGLALLGY